MRSDLASASQRFTWERVSAPLLAYCRAPWRLGMARGNDVAATYVHNLERLYSETAQYARQLERVPAEKDAALQYVATPVEGRRRPGFGGSFRAGAGAAGIGWSRNGNREGTPYPGPSPNFGRGEQERGRGRLAFVVLTPCCPVSWERGGGEGVPYPSSPFDSASASPASGGFGLGAFLGFSGFGFFLFLGDEGRALSLTTISSGSVSSSMSSGMAMSRTYNASSNSIRPEMSISKPDGSCSGRPRISSVACPA